MQLVIIILLIFAVLLVIFTLQNSMDITLNVFFWEFTNVPLVLILICTFVLGYIIASIYFYPLLWKKKKEYNQLIKHNKELKEIHGNTEAAVEDETNPEGMKLGDDYEGSFFKE